jgi:hypothetical protein
MMFVLVKENGLVIGKEAYGGDTMGLQASLDQRSTADPNLTFDLYDDSKEQEFDAIQLSSVQTASPLMAEPMIQQTDWKTAKAAGTDAALSFIGQKLGLE